MVACARSEIVRRGDVGVYMVGRVASSGLFSSVWILLTGHNFAHRREWLHRPQGRLARLSRTGRRGRKLMK